MGCVAPSGQKMHIAKRINVKSRAARGAADDEAYLKVFAENFDDIMKYYHEQCDAKTKKLLLSELNTISDEMGDQLFKEGATVDAWTLIEGDLQDADKKLLVKVLDKHLMEVEL